MSAKVDLATGDAREPVEHGKGSWQGFSHVRSVARCLADYEGVAVCALVAASLLSARLLPAALALAALFWGLRWLAYGRLTIAAPGAWPAALLALLVPVTLWVTPLPEVTRPAVYQLLAGMALYFAIVNWTISRSRLRWVLLAAITGGLLLALVSVLTVKWFSGTKLLFIPVDLYKHLPATVSDPVHPNVMAGALVLLLPIALAQLVFPGPRLPRHERLVAGLAALAMAAVLVLTKSRGGLVAFAATLAVLCVLRWRRGWLAIAAATLAAGAGTWRIGVPRIVEALSATQTVGGLSGRLEVWSRAIYMLQDFPFTGIGMGTFKQVANAMYPFFLAGPDADISHAHNLFLEVGVDLGLPGLIAWTSLLMLAVAFAWQTYRLAARSGDRWLMGVGAGLLGSQVALIVHGLVDAATWNTRPAIIVWALWGLAAVARRSLNGRGQ